MRQFWEDRSWTAGWGAFLASLIWWCPGAILLGLIEKDSPPGENKIWGLAIILGPLVLGALIGLVFPKIIEAVLDEDRWQRRSRRGPGHLAAAGGGGPDDDGVTGHPDVDTGGGGGD